MQVAPGIHCSDQGIGFPLFGGVSRQEQYFEIRTIDGVPPFHNSFVDYPEQTMLEMRIFFDTGEPIRSRDYLVAGMPPAGAKRVVRVEMDFSTGGEGKVTLKWSE
jgi:hypothetical protein